MLRNWNLYGLLVEMENGTDYMYNSVAFSQKDENIITIYFNNSNPRYIPQ